MQKINTRKIVLFLGLTFSVNWLLAGLFYLLGGQLNSIPGVAMAVIYMFIPMLAAITVQKFVYREPLQALGISFKLNRWFLAAWLLPPLLACLVTGASVLLFGAEFAPGTGGLVEQYRDMLSPAQLEQVKQQLDNQAFSPLWIGLLQGLVAGITVNAVAGFGEELGWRGFLQKELAPLGFWKSSLLIGFTWGVWHAPLVLQGHNFPQHPVAGAILMTAACTFLGVIFSFVTLKAGSVIAAAIIHGSFNGTIGLSIIATKEGSDVLTGCFGAAGITAYILVNLIILGATWKSPPGVPAAKNAL